MDIVKQFAVVVDMLDCTVRQLALVVVVVDMHDCLVKQLAVMVAVVMVVVVAVDMLDCLVDTHHCSVDTDELFHAYFFCVST